MKLCVLALGGETRLGLGRNGGAAEEVTALQSGRTNEATNGWRRKPGFQARQANGGRLHDLQAVQQRGDIISGFRTIGAKFLTTVGSVLMNGVKCSLSRKFLQ